MKNVVNVQGNMLNVPRREILADMKIFATVPSSIKNMATIGNKLYVLCSNAKLYEVNKKRRVKRVSLDYKTR